MRERPPAPPLRFPGLPRALPARPCLPRRPPLCGTRRETGGSERWGRRRRPGARGARWGGRGNVQDVLQGERRGLREGAPGGAAAQRRRGPAPRDCLSRRRGARRVGWAPPREPAEDQRKRPGCDGCAVWLCELCSKGFRYF